MTEKLYDADAYGKEFDATVLRVTDYKGKTAYILDRTFFFPEEGGQTPDRGTINGFEVTDVKIDGEDICHFIDGTLKEGETVHGVIDFEHRFRNMQCHSAEHIFSGLVFSRFGFNNVGFHLSDNSATMDYDGFLSDDDIDALELEANRIIFENRRIIAEYPDKQTLSAMSYRSKKELSGAVRIVTVEGVDVCACCAPHVHLTGEIGIFKVVSHEKYKGGVRVHYLAGFRALEDYRNKQNALSSISETLSLKSGDEADGVKNLSEEYRKLKFESVSLLNRIVLANFEKERDLKADYLLHVGGPEEIPVLDQSARQARNMCGSFSLFAGSDDNGYRFVVEGNGLDAAKAGSILREKYGAKCGGKDNSLRGSIDLKSEEIKDIFRELSFLSV